MGKEQMPAICECMRSFVYIFQYLFTLRKTEFANNTWTSRYMNKLSSLTVNLLFPRVKLTKCSYSGL